MWSSVSVLTVNQERKTYEIEIGERAELSRLNVQILERLGGRVNVLINELTLNLISRKSRPPQVFVEVVSSGLKNGLRNVDVAAMLDDFLVDNLGDLSSRVLLGTVKLECLRRGIVIVQHALKSSSDIDGLAMVSDYS